MCLGASSSSQKLRGGRVPLPGPLEFRLVSSAPTRPLSVSAKGKAVGSLSPVCKGSLGTE